jgi:hypothetical protein
LERGGSSAVGRGRTGYWAHDDEHEDSPKHVELYLNTSNKTEKLLHLVGWFISMLQNNLLPALLWQINYPCAIITATGIFSHCCENISSLNLWYIILKTDEALWKDVAAFYSLFHSKELFWHSHLVSLSD